MSSATLDKRFQHLHHQRHHHHCHQARQVQQTRCLEAPARPQGVETPGSPSAQPSSVNRAAFSSFSDSVRNFQSSTLDSRPLEEGGIPTRNRRESYLELIDKDIQTAYGRKATQADYEYWLPKFEGPCDSGFVTNGQMTGTEYWHRRLLGWQAGGQDMATSGPYAGSPNAQGPVPRAIDVVSDVSAGGAYDFASPQSIRSFRSLINADFKSSYGREANEQDYTYWLNKMLGPNDSGFVTSGQMTATEYWHRRLLGWQAGGQDVALYGPYAGGTEATGPVPSATSIVPNVPPRGVF